MVKLVTKICRSCGVEKALSEFHKKKDTKDGLCLKCKVCVRTAQNRYYKTHSEERRTYQNAYDSEHAEEKRAYNQKYFVENREQMRQQSREYYRLNRDKCLASMKAYRNKEKVRLCKLKCADNRLRRQTDVNFRLRTVLRSRLVIAIRSGQKAGSAVRDLGCTIEELKTYLESKFQPGMTWENWSRTGWHVDHIKPLASFDLTDREQFLQACHYTNLQPLWATDNLQKGDKVA